MIGTCDIIPVHPTIRKVILHRQGNIIEVAIAFIHIPNNFEANEFVWIVTKHEGLAKLQHYFKKHNAYISFFPSSHYQEWCNKYSRFGSTQR